MTSPLVGRPPTCLACLRRITSPASSSQTGNASIALTQVRGKKTEGRLRDQGVVVRLLKDVPQFGPEGSIFRTDRGRMRNHFFPNRKAEYMTRARLSELGLTKQDIGERDYMFGVNRREGSAGGDAVDAVAGLNLGSTLGAFGAPPAAPVFEAAKPAVEIEHLPPNRALELMQTLIDETLIFERRLVHPPPAAGKTTASPEPSSASALESAKAAAKPTSEQAKKALSPLEQRRSMLRGQTEAEKAAKAKEEEKKEEEEEERLAAAKVAEELEREQRQKEKEAEERRKIHGSVSLQHIASVVKEKMMLDPEAVRIHVQPEDIQFIGLGAGVDKVEKIGSFEVEIRAHVGKARVEPIRRTITVVPH